MEDTLEIVKGKSEEHRIIIINAWNEWGEGNYLEPDLKFGNGYLETLKDALTR